MPPLPPPADVAVIGGGITGLATAHYLSNALPNSTKIVLLEASARPGGWIHSQRINLPPAPSSSSPCTALVEHGPRSLRPKGHTALAMLDLVNHMGLWDRMLRIPNTAPSAQKRFIWSQDRINLLPSGLQNLYRLLTAPVLRRNWTDALRDLRTPPRASALPRPRSESLAEASRMRMRNRLMSDESVHSFLVRRFGGRTGLAEDIVSAAVHGIWAGDTRNLSVRSLFGGLWDRERTHGRLLFGRQKPRVPTELMSPAELRAEQARSQAAWNETQERTLLQAGLGDERMGQLAQTSIYSFPEGLGELTDALQEKLRAKPNVTLAIGTPANGLKTTKDGVRVGTANGSIHASKVIAALPSLQLDPILNPALPSSLLTEPSANVGTVNVVVPAWVAKQIRPTGRLLQVEGFGVLIPRSEEPRNQDKILGVVIDSDALPTQDAEPHVKLTVMLGGAYWANLSPDQLPSLEEVAKAGKRAVTKIVGLPEEALSHPATYVHAAIARQCIPWYTVGHAYRMAQLHQHLLRSTHDGGWGGRLTLTGASYTGVSLNDCVYHARRVALAIARGETSTGLEPIALEAGLLEQ